ncbi:MAG: sulfite exporter TauE/SafE family protein [Nitrospinota bacterium]
MDIGLNTIVAYALASLLTGFFKTSFGGGIGMVVAPILTMLISPRLTMGIIAPLMVLGDLLVVYFFWKRWDGKFIVALLPSMAVGAVGGTMLIAYLSNAGIRYVIALFALTYAVYHLVRMIRRTEIAYAPPNRTAGHLVGLLAGFSTSAAHSGGIITSPYFVASGLTKGAVVATGFGLYAITNWVKLGSYVWAGLVNGHIMLLTLYTLPLLALGAYLGNRAHRAASSRVFNSVILILAISGALKLLLF